MRSPHLPYQICPEENRFDLYETLWKKVGLNLLRRYCLATGQHVLDYGCGRGEVLDLFGAAGFKVTGTDVDPECVRLARRYGPACLLAEDPVSQFGAKSFDIVTCFHVLEHVDSPKRTLIQLARIARCFVVLAVPNLRYLHGLFARPTDLSRVNQGHLQAWDHWHLLNLAQNHCGLELVQWASDATILPLVSNLSLKLLGQRATVFLETGPFRWLFPFHCISVLGLFRPALVTARGAAAEESGSATKSP
jgi:SAM-dependent methyltransferase